MPMGRSFSMYAVSFSSLARRMPHGRRGHPPRDPIHRRKTIHTHTHTHTHQSLMQVEVLLDNEAAGVRLAVGIPSIPDYTTTTEFNGICTNVGKPVEVR